MKSWLEKNTIEMYSIHDKIKSVLLKDLLKPERTKLISI